MKTSDKIKGGVKMPGRNTWRGVDPRTKVVKPKKGKGSYRRSTMRGLERKGTSESRDLLYKGKRSDGPLMVFKGATIVKARQECGSSGTFDAIAKGL